MDGSDGLAALLISSLVVNIIFLTFFSYSCGTVAFCRVLVMSPLMSLELSPTIFTTSPLFFFVSSF